mmetsp:Transcript_68934/g.121870  ORF Transcript_68934/g.121870 Transcript_68934/m.121870 type:complete len:603 (+) Transcript_68934:72-1880(+)
MGGGASVLLHEEPSFYNQYELLQKVGQGSYGKVYLAKDRYTNENVAVKAQAARLGKERAIADEAQVWKSLGSHPNIVSFFEMRQEVNVFFLIMEICCQGLFDRVTHAPKWTASELMADFLQALRGIEHMHVRRIVHRDVKVQNFLYGSPGTRTLKLADFGLSTRVPRDTNLEAVCGSPAFMAPEMVLKNGYGLKIDMWALGVTYYMLMYGTLPVGKTKMTAADMKEAIKDPNATKKSMQKALTKAELSPPHVRHLALAALDLVQQLFIREPNSRPDAKMAMNCKFLTWPAESAEAKKSLEVLVVDRPSAEQTKQAEEGKKNQGGGSSSHQGPSADTPGTKANSPPPTLPQKSSEFSSVIPNGGGSGGLGPNSKKEPPGMAELKRRLQTRGLSSDVNGKAEGSNAVLQGADAGDNSNMSGSQRLSVQLNEIGGASPRTSLRSMNVSLANSSMLSEALVSAQNPLCQAMGHEPYAFASTPGLLSSNADAGALPSVRSSINSGGVGVILQGPSHSKEAQERQDSGHLGSKAMPAVHSDKSAPSAGNAHPMAPAHDADAVVAAESGRADSGRLPEADPVAPAAARVEEDSERPTSRNSDKTSKTLH